MKNFSDFNLSEPIQRALTELGFQSPSPIQEQTLPLLLEKATDILGLAATGTGKTAAFGIPLLEKLDSNVKGVQALILCPTRELALQVSGQINLIGKYKKIQCVPIYGGAGYAEQLSGLRSGASVVVGTPGRILDHLQRKTLVLKNLKTLVLDEADEMISMGFKEDLESILERVPEGQANVWLFSATMSTGVQKVANQYLKNPEKVQVNQSSVVPTEVEQFYYFTQESNKPDVLCKIIDAASDFYGIVFCQTKALVVELNQFLMNQGYRSDCLHGDMTQKARDKSMKNFRERKTSVLIATDVACRGLDVNDITHVVNYSIPRELENYIHRIGRTGRNGKKGLALSLVTKSHKSLLSQIERMTKTPVKEAPIPTFKEIGAKKLSRSLAQLQEVEFPKKAQELFSEEWTTFLEGISKEELASRFLSLLHPELFNSKKKEMQKDLLSTQNHEEDSRQGFGRRRERNRGGERGGRSDRGGRPSYRSDRSDFPRRSSGKPPFRKRSEGGAEGGERRFSRDQKRNRPNREKSFSHSKPSRHRPATDAHSATI